MDQDQDDLHAALIRSPLSDHHLAFVEKTTAIFDAMFASLNAWPEGAPPKTDDHDVNSILSRCRVAENGCWEWTGASNASGYGRVRIGRRLYLPHRIVAAGAGIISEAADTTDRRVCVLHECDNPRCCNPAHLRAGTMSQNMKDCVKRGRHKRISHSKPRRRRKPQGRLTKPPPRHVEGLRALSKSVYRGTGTAPTFTGRGPSISYRMMCAFVERGWAEVADIGLSTFLKLPVQEARITKAGQDAIRRSKPTRHGDIRQR